MVPLSYYTDSLAVLVVDDDPLMLRMLEAMLRTDRHTVKVAGDAEIALEVFKTQSWSLVLTDYNLPGKTGEQLAQAVKKHSPTTPVLIMTGLSAISNYAGADAIIRKPFTRTGIATAINRALKGEHTDEGPSEEYSVIPRS